MFEEVNIYLQKSIKNFLEKQFYMTSSGCWLLLVGGEMIPLSRPVPRLARPLPSLSPAGRHYNADNIKDSDFSTVFY